MSDSGERDVFDSMCVLDFRYYDEEVAKYLSENARIRYLLEFELALIHESCLRNKCHWRVYHEIKAACDEVKAGEVYTEEGRIGHDIRALVNCISEKVSDEAKPYVHRMATSYDAIDTAVALCYRDVAKEVLIPSMKKLCEVLARLTLREANTVQIGRTHGQHAVPITFGFAIANYVSRLGSSIMYLDELSSKLCGKFSGAVGAYNASSLVLDNPEDFELGLLTYLGLNVAEHSTQIVPPEPLARLLSEAVIAFGIMADLADSMRHLMRTEIGEVCESFGKFQVGSSAMPNKVNPINFENVKGMFTIVAPRMLTVYSNIPCEHQRALTNSVPSRTYPEIIAYTVSATKRLTRTMDKLVVDRENMARNIEMCGDQILAEPYQIALSVSGCPDGHEQVRLAARQSKETGPSIRSIITDNSELKVYLDKLSNDQGKKLPESAYDYIGIAAEKAKKIATQWLTYLETP